MKNLFKSSRPLSFVLIVVGLAFISAAFSPSGTITQTPTLTPTPAETAPGSDLLIGSTDGILIWAFIITLIVIIPLLWNWRLWHQQSIESKTPR